MFGNTNNCPYHCIRQSAIVPNKLLKQITMSTIYLNCKTSYGIETVDEFTREKGQNQKDFRRYVNKMIEEYRLSGMDVYKSRRSCREWKNR